MRKPNHGLGRWRSALATTAMLSLAAGVASAQTVTIRSGTMIEGKLDTAITTKVARPGDPVAIRTTEALRIDQWTTLPAGLVLRGEITESRRGGRVRTPPKIAMTFTQLEFDGETYDIATEPFVVRGKSGTSNTLKKVGIGAVAGAVVGGAAGGGSGAVKGTIVGAAIGTGVAIATDGKNLVLPAEQRLSIRLNAPVSVRYRPEFSRHPR